MNDNLEHYEDDVARLLTEHWEEAQMDEVYRLNVLDRTRRAVSTGNRSGAGRLGYAFAALAATVVAAFLIWRLLAVPAGSPRTAQNPRTGTEQHSITAHGVNTPPAPKPQAPMLAGAPDTHKSGPKSHTNKPGFKQMASNGDAKAVQGSKGTAAAPAPAVKEPFVVITAMHVPVTDQNKHSLKIGDRLALGSAILTGDRGRVTLVTRKGAELSLDANSKLILTAKGITEISRGRMFCSNRDKEIRRIDTPAGQIQLLGTVVNTAVLDKKKVAVTVIEGKVRLSNAKGNALVDSGRRSMLLAYLPPESGKPVNTSADTAWYDGRGEIQSDSGEIAYTIAPKGTLSNEIWVMDADGGNRRRVKSYIGFANKVGSWVPGEQWLQLSTYSALWTTPDVQNRRANSGAGHPIVGDGNWLVNAATGQDEPVQLPQGYKPLYPTLSPDARRLAFSGWYQPDPKNRENVEGGVWVYDLGKNQIKKVLSGWIKTTVAWAPDNRRIAASTGEDYGTNYPLVVVDVDSGQVTDLNLQGVGAAFSPDGTRLAYCGDFKSSGSWYTGIPTSGSIWVKDLTTDTKPVEVSPSGEGAILPHWSPDGTRIMYSVHKWGDDKSSFSLHIAQADGSGSREIYHSGQTPSDGWRPGELDTQRNFAHIGTKLMSATWARSGDSVYATTDQALLLVAADGSGVRQVIPTDEKSSVLTPEQKAQSDAANAEIQEAIFRFAMGKVSSFEGNPARVRESFRASADIFAGLVWKYPLAGFSVSDVMAYADKAESMAAKSDAQILSESCQERISYAGILAGYSVRKQRSLPSDLKGIEDWALTSEGWGINWLFSKDKEHTRMVLTCPGAPGHRSTSYVYSAPPKGAAPRIGDVLLSCPNHPENKVVWDEGMQSQWDRAMKAK